MLYSGPCSISNADMKKPIELTGEQLNSILGKEGRTKMESLNEQMSEIGRQIAFDQQHWVDKCMKDILPPPLYDDCVHNRNHEAVAGYMNRNDIKLIHMADTLRIRIMIRGQIYGEWKANL